MTSFRYCPDHVELALSEGEPPPADCRACAAIGAFVPWVEPVRPTSDQIKSGPSSDPVDVERRAMGRAELEHDGCRCACHLDLTTWTGTCPDCGFVQPDEGQVDDLAVEQIAQDRYSRWAERQGRQAYRGHAITRLDPISESEHRVLDGNR